MSQTVFIATNIDINSVIAVYNIDIELTNVTEMILNSLWFYK